MALWNVRNDQTAAGVELHYASRAEQASELVQRRRRQQHEHEHEPVGTAEPVLEPVR